MDFFAHQDRARASSRRLIVLYLLSVLGVVVTLNVVAAVIWGQVEARQASPYEQRVERAEGGAGLDLTLHAMVTLGVLAVIGIATLYKSSEIGGDGANVASLLGGRMITGTPGDLAERRLLNVVEEMSLASGVPMPRVFILDRERGLNAFAAGLRTDQAVVAVTRGLLDALDREQLQGVIAHEFSHILNGDMRLNIRLIALNFGIMALGYIGLQMLRFSPHHGGSRRNNKDNGAAAMLLFALAMVILGYVGTLFGKILQAAVSRQREYLADAAAVQFTRNPNGIAGALKRIGGFTSELETPHAGEASHLFFADGVTGFLDGLFATHPPLDKRIKAIDPSFDGRMIARDVAPQFDDEADDDQPLAGFAPNAGARHGATARQRPSAQQRPSADDEPMPLEPEEVTASVPGSETTIAAEDIARAAPLIASIPRDLRAAVREPYDARAIALALLLDPTDAGVRARQLQVLAQADVQVQRMAEAYRVRVATAGAAARLPILELALPALQQLSPAQRQQFRGLCRTLAEADRVLSPFELAMFKIIDHALPDAHRQEDRGTHFASVTSVAEHAGTILSTLALAGGADQADRAYAAGLARLQLARPPARVRHYDADAFAVALSTVRAATIGVRRRIVDAAAHTVAFDGQVRVAELELLRAACAAFDVPLPPVLRRG